LAESERLGAAAVNRAGLDQVVVDQAHRPHERGGDGRGDKGIFREAPVGMLGLSV